LKSWSGSDSRKQLAVLYSVSEVVRTLMPVYVVHQYTQFVLDTVFYRQPVQLMEHWSNVFMA